MMRIAVIGVLLLSSGVARAQAIVVPFDTIQSRHMIVDVLVNGKGPYTLIFDTGAPVTLVGTKLAKEAKVAKNLSFFSFGQQQKIDNLELGGVKLAKVDAMVMDHPIVDAIAGATRKKIDGIVGFNVFGNYKTTIDYQAKTLTFHPSDFRPTNMMESLMKLMMPSIADLERVPVIAPAGVLGIRVAKKADDEGDGIDVEAVLPGSPAAEAGLQTGDRLLSIDRRWTDRPNDCSDALRTIRPGDTIDVEILRGGQKRTLKAKIAAGF